MPSPVTVTILIENSAPKHSGICREHGLSLHIDTGEGQILFDCGASANVLQNAKTLGIDLGKTATVVLSHSHYDHGGGFQAIAQNFRPTRLITGSGFFWPKYSRVLLRRFYSGVGFNSQYLQTNSIHHEECRQLIQLNDRCWVVGAFRRKFSEESIPSRFYRRREGRWELDDFSDEVCLVLRMNDELAVFVGCAHPGLINILQTVRDVLGLPIRSVWGGVHVRKAGNIRLAFTLEQLKRLEVRQAGFCHCSGEAIQEIVEKDGAISTRRIQTGDTIMFF